jgi:hypothetical protein
MPSSGFTFRPLTEADLPLLRERLNRPHLQEWWREEEVTLDGLREKYPPSSLTIHALNDNHSRHE